MENNFTEFINDSVRILIILDNLKDRKSPNTTIYRIMLYDYYLRFPNTMKDSQIDHSEFGENLDEHYSYFNSCPDIIRYRRSIDYLRAKGLLTQIFNQSKVVYVITELGTEAIHSVSTTYKDKLTCLISKVLPELYGLSDSKIWHTIQDTSKDHLWNGSVDNED